MAGSCGTFEGRWTAAAAHRPARGDRLDVSIAQDIVETHVQKWDPTVSYWRHSWSASLGYRELYSPKFEAKELTPVLKAMGLKPTVSRPEVRFGFKRFWESLTTLMLRLLFRQIHKDAVRVVYRPTGTSAEEGNGNVHQLTNYQRVALQKAGYR